MVNPPANFVNVKPGVYWILGYEPSDKDPDKRYEIRTSMRDGKTYCNCTACSMSYHRNDGPAKCKHLDRFRARNPNVPIILMDLEGFVAVKRATALVMEETKLGAKVKVERHKL